MAEQARRGAGLQRLSYGQSSNGRLVLKVGADIFGRGRGQSERLRAARHQRLRAIGCVDRPGLAARIVLRLNVGPDGSKLYCASHHFAECGFMPERPNRGYTPMPSETAVATTPAPSSIRSYLQRAVPMTFLVSGVVLTLAWTAFWGMASWR